MRVGIGYDVHRLAEGQELILGGIEIPFEKGLAGWSDGDVAVHAIIDALLGAASLGDIGTHFPSDNPAYEGISSLILLVHTKNLLEDNQYIIENIDVTIVAQKPRIAPFANQMKERIATTLSVKDSQVNIKAKTTDGLGFTGEGTGIAVHAVAMVRKSNENL